MVSSDWSVPFRVDRGRGPLDLTKTNARDADLMDESKKGGSLPPVDLVVTGANGEGGGGLGR